MTGRIEALHRRMVAAYSGRDNRPFRPVAVRDEAGRIHVLDELSSTPEVRKATLYRIRTIHGLEPLDMMELEQTGIIRNEDAHRWFHRKKILEAMLNRTSLS